MNLNRFVYVCMYTRVFAVFSVTGVLNIVFPTTKSLFVQRAATLDFTWLCFSQIKWFYRDVRLHRFPVKGSIVTYFLDLCWNRTSGTLITRKTQQIKHSLMLFT